MSKMPNEMSDALLCEGLTLKRSGEAFRFDFTLARGELLVLVGPSGAGKSTLLDLLGAFTPAEAGTLRWQGQDLLALPPTERPFRPSIAWRICLVAEGRFYAALSFRPAWDWDIAAAALIAERAGARVSDARGAALRFDRASAQNDGLLIAPPELHRDLLGRMALTWP